MSGKKDKVAEKMYYDTVEVYYRLIVQILL